MSHGLIHFIRFIRKSVHVRFLFSFVLGIVIKLNDIKFIRTSIDVNPVYLYVSLSVVFVFNSCLMLLPTVSNVRRFFFSAAQREWHIATFSIIITFVSTNSCFIYFRNSTCIFVECVGCGCTYSVQNWCRIRFKKYVNIHLTLRTWWDNRWMREVKAYVTQDIADLLQNPFIEMLQHLKKGNDCLETLIMDLQNAKTQIYYEIIVNLITWILNVPHIARDSCHQCCSPSEKNRYH